MSDDTTNPHLRLHEAPDGRKRPATVNVAAYLRDLAALIGEAFGRGRAMVLNRTFVDDTEGVPEFVIVPVHGLTTEQAATLTTQWSLDVCDILGIEPQTRPTKPPELALSLLAQAAENAERESPDDPGGGAA